MGPAERVQENSTRGRGGVLSERSSEDRGQPREGHDLAEEGKGEEAENTKPISL